MKKAVVLLSGGIDSATAAVIARKDGFELYAMSFLYGQRHAVEINAAKHIASFLAVKDHTIVTINLSTFGGSALTTLVEEVPKNRGPRDSQDEIPRTYVPARNTIFLSYALGYAEVLGAQDIFIGVNAVDYSGYPDCRPEYIAAYETMANLATRAGVQGSRIVIRTPLIALTKAEIITLGSNLGLDYAITHSCYDPDSAGGACGLCDSCFIRREGFKSAGLPDATRYANRQD